MTFRRMIRLTILRWERWRFERRFPELARINAKIREAQARHQRTAHLVRTQRDLIISSLKGIAR